MSTFYTFSDFEGQSIVDKNGKRIGSLIDVYIHAPGFCVESFVVRAKRYWRNQDILLSPPVVERRPSEPWRVGVTKKDIFTYHARCREAVLETSSELPAALDMKQGDAWNVQGPWGTYMGAPSWAPHIEQPAKSREEDEIIRHHRQYQLQSFRRFLASEWLDTTVILRDGEQAGPVGELLFDVENWHLAYVLLLCEDRKHFDPIPARFLVSDMQWESELHIDLTKKQIERGMPLADPHEDFNEYELMRAYVDRRHLA